MTRLTPAEALLSCAAATDHVEMLAARTSLITSGGGILRDIDTTDLVSGDGTAGRRLLGGTGLPHNDSCAARSSRLQVRLFAQLVRDAAGAGTR